MKSHALAALLVSAMLAFPALAVGVEQPPGGVRTLLEQPDVLRGHFEQEKQLQGFRNPLRSSGAFLLVREHGIAWDTTKPFASSAVLTRESLSTQLPDGSRQVLLDAADGPVAGATATLLVALVGGDLDALAERFDIEEMPLDAGAWQLVLTPREPALQQVFSRFVLSGDRYVREVLIEEAAGDRTWVRLSELASDPATPTPAEVARFE